MVADCPANCARFSLCLSNFVFIIVSTAMLVVGTWVAASKDTFLKHVINIANSTKSPNPFTALAMNKGSDTSESEAIENFVEPVLIDNAAYILIAIGAFIFILSFLGYCGSIKESRVLLTAYGIFIIIIFCMEIAVVVLAVMFKESHVDQPTKNFLTNTLTEHYSVGDDKDAVAVTWDHIMGHFSCCGVMDHTDFAKAKDFAERSRDNQKIPEACCKLKENGDGIFEPEDPNCVTNPNEDNSYMNTGCFGKINMVFKEEIDIVISVVVCVVALELLAAIFAFCLCRATGKEQDYTNHYKY